VSQLQNPKPSGDFDRLEGLEAYQQQENGATPDSFDGCGMSAPKGATIGWIFPSDAKTDPDKTALLATKVARRRSMRDDHGVSGTAALLRMVNELLPTRIFARPHTEKFSKQVSNLTGVAKAIAEDHPAVVAHLMGAINNVSLASVHKITAALEELLMIDGATSDTALDAVVVIWLLSNTACKHQAKAYMSAKLWMLSSDEDLVHPSRLTLNEQLQTSAMSEVPLKAMQASPGFQRLSPMINAELTNCDNEAYAYWWDHFKQFMCDYMIGGGLHLLRRRYSWK
jgi:hypothetical protein